MRILLSLFIFFVFLSIPAFTQNGPAPTWTAEGIVQSIEILQTNEDDIPTSMEISINVGPYGRKLASYPLSLAAMGSMAETIFIYQDLKVGDYISANGPIEQVRAPHSNLFYVRLKIKSFAVHAIPIEKE